MKENLILLHGALGSRDQLKELNEILSVDYNVFDFNFAGHGGRAMESPFSIDLFVQNTLDFMQESGLHATHFFGYSMGGYVALKLAHDVPGKAKKIITLGTKFNWTPESAAKEVRMMNPEVIEQKVPAFADTLRVRHEPEDWKEVMSLTAAMMTALGKGDVMTLDQFSFIPNEVMVCVGTEDKMVTREESAEVAGYLKNGQLNIIEGFKHPMEAIDKSILAEICNEFLLNK